MSMNMQSNLLVTTGWESYSLRDSGSGRRLEQFGAYLLSRPDPQVLWLPNLSPTSWDEVDAVFQRGTDGKENWTRLKTVPDRWEMAYRDIKFYARLSPFKHTGVFPEQAVQWDFLANYIAKKSIKVLNLFAYTGIASLVCAAAGAEVTHVDSSSAAISWAKDNQTLSGLSDKPIRWILDDVVRFIEREARRGNKYDGIIMDPPIYGHGPSHEVWDFMKHFPQLIKTCVSLLSEKPSFVLVNAYAISASALMLENVLMGHLADKNGHIKSGELALKEKDTERLLSTGIYSLWSQEEV